MQNAQHRYKPVTRKHWGRKSPVVCLTELCLKRFSGNPWHLFDLTWERFSVSNDVVDFWGFVCCHIASVCQKNGQPSHFQSICGGYMRGKRGQGWIGRVHIPSWYCINLKGCWAALGDSGDTESSDQSWGPPPSGSGREDGAFFIG